MPPASPPLPSVKLPKGLPQRIAIPSADISLPPDADPLVYGQRETERDSEPSFFSWSERPRTLTIGTITVLFFLYAIFKDTPPDADLEYNVKRGIKYACFFFLIYCVCELRDGHFIRPHPVVWRLVTGCFILYEMFLVFLLFQSTDDARRLLKYLDPSLGVELPERAYGEDCRVYTPEDPSSSFRNLRDTLFDEFVLMHAIGWFVGTLMIRDYFICWTLSILFEFYEMTFSHWLPNFNECWWDHVFFDVLICNALGIYLGMKTCKWFEMKQYNWMAIKLDQSKAAESQDGDQERKEEGKQRRKREAAWGAADKAMSFLMPAGWIRYRWGVFESPSRFFFVMFMIVGISVMLLNAFFLKAILWIPPPNPLNIYRLFLVFSAGSYGIAEFYLFLTRPHAKKLGPRAWLCIGVLVTEVVFIVKHRGDMFSEPFPSEVKYSWAVSLSLLTVFFTSYFVWKAKYRGTQGNLDWVLYSPRSPAEEPSTRDSRHFALDGPQARDSARRRSKKAD